MRSRPKVAVCTTATTNIRPSAYEPNTAPPAASASRDVVSSAPTETRFAVLLRGDTLCYVVGKNLEAKKSAQRAGRAAARRKFLDQEMFVGTIQIFWPCSLPVSDIPCSFGKYIIRLTCTRTLHSRKAHHFQGKSQIPDRIFSSRAARAPKICVTA